MSTEQEFKPRLGNLLVQKGYLTQEGLDAALVEQHADKKGRLLGEILVDVSACTDDQVAECIAHEYGAPYAKLETRIFDAKCIDVLPREFIEKNFVLPLYVIRDTLTIAVSEPSNLFLVEEIEKLAKMPVQLVVSTAKDIRRMIATLPNSKVFVIDDIIDEGESGDVDVIDEKIEDISDIEENGVSPVIRLVNFIIYNAVKEGASDIHMEPADKVLRVRYRIDGRLYKSLEVPIHLVNAITSRIKIMASMDISERRLPQDGRIHVMLDGRKVDLRCSTFPMTRGEKTVIRVLDTRATSLQLEDLGFGEDILTDLRSEIRQPNGIALVTGPTGSGKSTTLYSMLNDISSMENNICTVEDPIEYNLPLINQFQVQERVGLTFARALRTLLRQDPDVIMVGEVRDEETARTAIQAALTGHLVFSTLHTNDAVSAVTRMVNMGVETYLIGAALNMVLAQRLVRKVCSKCRQSYEPPRQVRKAIERMGFEMKEFFRGVGCKRCRNTGYSGRIGIHELFVIDDELRDAIVADPSTSNLRPIAERKNMVTLKIDGFRKVREGITTIEEIMHVVGESRDAAELVAAVEATAGTEV